MTAMLRRLLHTYALPTVLCLVLSSGMATAAGWTIQTVALRDLRDAQATADDLRTFGFDAYTEFAMWEGEQFVRVRFGCYGSRDAAEEMAVRVRTSFVANAVPVERTPGAPAEGCLEERTGFLKPAYWRQLDDGLPAFEVEIGNTTAVVRHNGLRWRITQETEVLPDLLPAAPAHFRQGLVGDVPVVEIARGGSWLVVCPGRLLAEVGEVAIVDRGDRIVSCRLQHPNTVVDAN